MSRVFIIAEAGSNWYSAMDMNRYQGLSRARTLIYQAHKAGADAVKFQVFSAASMYVPDAGPADYLGSESINSIIAKVEMPKEWIPQLEDDCRCLGIEFMASVFSIEDAKAVDPYVKRHKVASYELGHLRLIQFLAATGKPLIVSTGAATGTEIEKAVFVWQKGDLTLLHCTASYPAPIDQLNLSAMRSLWESAGTDFGLSDHSEHPTLAPVMAVALGASVIEKHFTLSRTLEGPDHRFALEPRELREMVLAVRMAEAALGDGEKKPQRCEMELRKFAVRAVQALKDLRPGDRLEIGVNIDVLRPGKRRRGAPAHELDSFDGRVVRLPISAGDGVTKEMLK